MFLNKWTAQVNYPGKIIEEAFDSEEELLNYVGGLEAASDAGLHPIITVIDPGGQEKAIQAVHQPS